MRRDPTYATDHQPEFVLSMQTALALELGSSHRVGGVARTWTPVPASPTAIRDHAFVALLTALRPFGGLMRVDDLADVLVRRGQGDHASLARAIVSGELISFEWNRDYWVPVFQLDGYSLVLKSGARKAVAQLAGVFDGWDVSIWFATPNPWLAERAPVQVIEEDEDAVADAARAARFVVKG